MERLERLRSPRIWEKLWLACGEKMISDRVVGAIFCLVQILERGWSFSFGRSGDVYQKSR